PTETIPQAPNTRRGRPLPKSTVVDLRRRGHARRREVGPALSDPAEHGVGRPTRRTGPGPPEAGETPNTKADRDDPASPKPGESNGERQSPTDDEHAPAPDTEAVPPPGRR